MDANGFLVRRSRSRTAQVSGGKLVLQAWQGAGAAPSGSQPAGDLAADVDGASVLYRQWGVRAGHS